MFSRRSLLCAGVAGALAAAMSASMAVAAEKKYGPGVSDTEIRLGQTMPYSGPASAYGLQGVVQQAFFRELNEKGGINGRKINLISLDDAYSPPKAVEQTRKLVENEEVLAIYGSLGTPSNTAIQKYLNSKKIPHILISTGASKWNDPSRFPWTTPFFPLYDVEGEIFGRYVAENYPNAKIAILSQNDDSGRDYVKGFRAGLGEKTANIVSEATYEVTDATVDSQMVKLKNSGADVFFLMATPKFGAQAIRKKHELGWNPVTVVASVAASIGSVLKPAGFEAAQGLITAAFMKTPGDPQYNDSPDMKEYAAFLKRHNLEQHFLDTNAVLAYISATVLTRALQNAGDDLTRENVLKQVANLKITDAPLLLDGVIVETAPDNYSAFNTLRLQRFKGESYELFGEPLTVNRRK
ncbi:ABC transporter substrate-binding protein [Camelimonas abortus]|uniref:ABC transporter substrate-binding protein n=1 Tax=Camelimonas abortus TaxID=1017184 RepID=A0ABV7LEW4_9HYPH